MPVVNSDHKHYTPCFILEEEQVENYSMQNYYTQNDEKLFNTHKLKLEPSLEATIVTPFQSFGTANDSLLFLPFTFSWSQTMDERKTTVPSAR
jgi:hypothetical protein